MVDLVVSEVVKKQGWMISDDDIDNLCERGVGGDVPDSFDDEFKAMTIDEYAGIGNVVAVQRLADSFIKLAKKMAFMRSGKSAEPKINKNEALVKRVIKDVINRAIKNPEMSSSELLKQSIDKCGELMEYLPQYKK
ncbi:MAG: hypothetical protein L0G80_13925 [Shewanella sp.]|uniref:hypothetical protein n=1 Tax=Shewanella sp. TaxID=50422 RepID=UPI00264A0D79|nr:hypothetical protein [Shewanella sp.]MDN5501015.1 hypothetical protein [Shewanella sp.]MDN5529042.1 hypothetical protein [Shewanella sp.]